MGNTVGTDKDPAEFEDSSQGARPNRGKKEPTEDHSCTRIIKTAYVSPHQENPSVEPIEIVIPPEPLYSHRPSQGSLAAGSSCHSITPSFPTNTMKPSLSSSHGHRRNTLSNMDSVQIPLSTQTTPLFAGTGQFTKRLSLQHSGIPYFDSRMHRREDPEALEIESAPRKSSLYDDVTQAIMMPFLSRKQTSAPESTFYDHKISQGKLARPFIDGMRPDIPPLSIPIHPLASVASPPLPTINTYSAPPPLQEPHWKPTQGSLLALNPTLHVSQTDLTQTPSVQHETLYLTETETLSSSFKSLHTSPPPPPKIITAAQIALLPPYPFLTKSSENSASSQQTSGVDNIPLIPIRSEKRLPKSTHSIEKLKLSSYSNVSISQAVASPEEEPIDAQPPKLPRYLLRDHPSRSSSHHSLHKDDSRRNSVDNYDLKKKTLRRHAWATQNASSHSSISSNIDLAKSSTSLLIPRPHSHLQYSKSGEFKEGSGTQSPVRANAIKILNASTDVFGLSSLSLNKGSKDSFQSLLAQFDTKPKKNDFFKCNSCSTLFVDYTLIKNDLEDTLKCASVYLHDQIYFNTLSINTQSHEMLSEIIHPLSKHIQFCTQIPSADDIFKYLECLFHAAELNVECAIITVIYIERLLHMAHVHLQVNNWARVVLGGILLASKVWDDHAVWNVDYCQIFPDVSVTDMNELERYILEQIQFDVSVKASHYAKTYFDLRKLSTGKGRKRSFKPLNIKDVHKFDAKTWKLSEDSMKDLKKSDSEAQEIELNLMESGVDRVAVTSRKFSASTLATAVTAATSVPRSSAIHGQHILPEEATAVVNAERSIRRAMSDYIFVSAKPPATLV